MMVRCVQDVATGQYLRRIRDGRPIWTKQRAEALEFETPDDAVGLWRFWPALQAHTIVTPVLQVLTPSQAARRLA